MFSGFQTLGNNIKSPTYITYESSTGVHEFVFYDISFVSVKNLISRNEN